MAPISPFELEALRLSLWVAVWSVVASLPFGLAVAWQPLQTASCIPTA